MALQLARSLRKNSLKSVVSCRGRVAQDEEVADEKPHEYFVVKDYDRNPFYMSLIHSQRPGYKKFYDPFLKHHERQDHAWRPEYYGQLRDHGLGWMQLFLLFFLPVQMILTYYWESRYRCFYKDPLGYNMGKGSEF